MKKKVKLIFTLKKPLKDTTWLLKLELIKKLKFGMMNCLILTMNVSLSYKF